ncbi:zinc-binding alcohol dehydrogenase family protein [Aspergillus saccharolyticus JOP 1030-1]|uniref:Putative zinc-binding dehydrogenase family oxidoreductase n=1 Tax=Aspergillus saccharolyticus JOP 1030-1 TaxID=1450539 RepID=A0A318ZCR9_9EURO|nr:putative zinc-binding dehydrogenase family oxidoreductase [Aspergillus saccharolyticus JOP 1030-1]PYH42433.1 putative zinc-binding dehydrogenase family oxidoreductase [Aspergillus saccharolyticus JOP 1030-1]
MTITQLPSNLPRSQTAILQTDGGRLEITHNVPLPHVPPDRMLVHVIAVALNPCDYKMPSQFPCKGVVNGTDYAGIIVAIGPEVARLPSRPRWKIGDAVFGACQGANAIDPESGSFAQYVRSDPELLFKKPEYMGWENAAAFGASGIATIALSLFWEGGMGLAGSPDEPAEEPEQVLVYAGSTSVGTLAIQLLRIYGHTPITTCSPRNFDLVRSYGAEEVFDYNLPTCGQDIQNYTNNNLELVLDPMTEAKTQRLCYQSIGRGGGRYIALEMWQPMNHTRPTVEPTFIMGSAIIGKEIPLGNGYGSEADPGKRQFGIQYYRQIQRLFDTQRLKSHPITVVEGGWQGVLDGLELLQSRTLSAQKLVVFLGTP